MGEELVGVAVRPNHAAVRATANDDEREQGAKVGDGHGEAEDVREAGEEANFIACRVLVQQVRDAEGPGSGLAAPPCDAPARRPVCECERERKTKGGTDQTTRNQKPKRSLADRAKKPLA